MLRDSAFRSASMSCRRCRAAYRGRYPWTRASVYIRACACVEGLRARKPSYTCSCACVRAREGRWNGGASDRGRSTVGDEGEESSLSRVREGDRERERQRERESNQCKGQIERERERESEREGRDEGLNQGRSR